MARTNLSEYFEEDSAIERLEALLRKCSEFLFLPPAPVQAWNNRNIDRTL